MASTSTWASTTSTTTCPAFRGTTYPSSKRSRPSSYEPLLAHRSYTKLLFMFLFDQEISLYSRIMRKERGTATLKDQSVPDKELLSA